MVQCSMEDTSHLRDEESDSQRDRETPPDLVAIVRSLKVENERLMRAQDEQEELNAVLLQILSDIQKHVQQGPSNAQQQQSEKLKTPSDAQNHGSSRCNMVRSSSKKRHQNVRKGRSGGGTSIESSSGNTTFMDLSSSDTRSSVPKKKRKRHSQSYIIE